MGANFTPTFDGYTEQQPFRYWCQTVLPLVYDDSLSYYDLLNKVVTYLNNVITDVSTVENNADALLNAYQQLQNYVSDYFENLNVQDEINNKLDEMATDGTLSQLIFDIYGNEITLKFAASVNEMTNTKLNYVLTPTSHVYTYSEGEWTDTGVIYGAVNNDTFLFRGVATGTTFASNSHIGFYRFTQSALENFSDAPNDLNIGGVLFNYKMATGGTAQTIIDTRGNSWFRLDTKPFVNTTQALINNSIVPCLKNNGEVSGTTLLSNSNIGFYNIPLASLTNFTDVPNDMQKGGTLFNYRMGTGSPGQTIIDTKGNTWFRWGTNEFVNVGKIMRDAVIKRDVTWYALGDSITQGFTGENGQISGVTQNNYVNTVAKLNGYTVTNYGTGGSGYVHNATVGDLLNARSKVDTINFANCDLVTLSFGVNDWHYDESIGDVTDNPSTGRTLCSNMKYCIEKILSDNPYAKIIVLTPLNSSKFGGDFSTNWGLGYAFPTAGTLANIVDKEKQICEYYGIEYVEMTKCSIVNRFNITDVLGDGLHPTPGLYPALGKDLASKINFK